MHARSLFSLAEHLDRLSTDGDPLEVLAGTVEFERFRPLLTRGLGYGDRAKVGRRPFDPVAMLKVLVVQAQHYLLDAGMEFMIGDRLSWMRFFGFDLCGAVPDENTIRHYRNRLTESGTLDALMQAFEQQLREVRYLAMGGQIVDATLVPAPKQRNTEDEKTAMNAGKSASQIWRGKPSKAHKKDVDACRTVKIGGKVCYRPDGTPLSQIAMPVSGNKSHISTEKPFRFIREAAVTSAADSNECQLHLVIDTANTASDVWADSTYRSSKKEAWLNTNMPKSRIHRRKPKGRPMPGSMARANAAKSAVPARFEHVFAHQMNRHGLFIRAISIARTQAKTNARHSRLQLRPPDFPLAVCSHGIGAPESRGRG